MSGGYVIAAAIGPVGRFIAAGRRSRDLWYGSRLISEVTRRYAQALVAHQGVTLWYPTASRIETPFFPRSPEALHRSPTISNKVLGYVVCEHQADAMKLLQGADREAREFLRDQLGVLADSRRFGRLLVRRRFDAQRDEILRGDFLEIFACLSPHASGAPHEASIRDALDTLDAAKNTRAFAAALKTPGVPRSSIDPGRDSVLEEYATESPSDVRARRRVGVGATERLDAVALLRRSAQFDLKADAKILDLPFPPLARIAVDPWVQGVGDADLGRLSAELDRIKPEVLAMFCSKCRDPHGSSSQKPFPYDTSLLLEHGLEALVRDLEPRQRYVEPRPSGEGRTQDAEDDGAALSDAAMALASIHPIVRSLHRKHGVPVPYYAILEADGDGIGERLKHASMSDLQGLVGSLYEFADSAWDIVEQAHHGSVFYAGGDELLAFLPVDHALGAAEALQKQFARSVSGGSLSCAVLFAHIKDDLRSTRRLVRDALGDTKRRRRLDGSTVPYLTLLEAPRSGVARSLTMPATRLTATIEAMKTSLEADILSMQTAHALRSLRDQLRVPDGSEVGLNLAREIVAAKPRRSGRKEAIDLGASAWKTWSDIDETAAAILLADRIRDVTAQRKGGGR